MARAIYKGILKLGSERAPVKLYSAAQDQNVHFRLLHAPDRQPIEQRMVDPATDETIPHAEARRGFRLDDGRYVILGSEDLARIEPEPTREIEVTRFVDSRRISTQWYDRPYFLGPDGDVDAYFALVEALRSLDKEGVVRWVMRKRRYVGALRAEGDYLMLIALRFAGEVLTADELPRPRAPAPQAAERRMAEQLIELYEGDFEIEAYRDEYRERVLELVQTKARGGKITPKRLRRHQPERALGEALKASISEARKRKKAA